MFDRVAERYDVTNTVLSGGLDASWRRATREALGARPGQTVLDVAVGTAVSTVELASGGVHAIACDFSQGMLRVGKRTRPGLPFVAGDGMRLPFRDATLGRPNVAAQLGTNGALDRLKRLAREAVEVIPDCPVRDVLRAEIEAQTRLFLPKSLAHLVSA